MTSNTFWIDWKDFGKRMSAELGTTSIEAGHGRIAQSREESETTARFLTKQRPPTSKIEKCQLSISSWSTLVWLTLAQARPTSRRKMKKKKTKNETFTDSWVGYALPNRNQCTRTIHSFIKEVGRMEPEAALHSRGSEVGRVGQSKLKPQMAHMLRLERQMCLLAISNTDHK